MAELGVTQAQFVEACAKATQNAIHKKIVDQISAVENFVAFKKLMNKRNEELNTQALLALTAAESKRIMEENKQKTGADAPAPTAAGTTDEATPKTPAPPVPQQPKMSKEEMETAKKLYEEE